MATENDEKEQGVPWWSRLPATPLDSKDQLVRFGIPPMHAHSCSKPDSRNNAGCPVAHLCDLPFKFDRPHRGGVELGKKTNSGPKIRRDEMDCFTFVHMRSAIQRDGGYVEWIADEGQEFSGVSETKAVKREGPNGIEWIHEPIPEDTPRIVKPFVRLADRPQVQDQLKIEAARTRELTRQEGVQRRKFLGMKDDLDPKANGSAHEGEPAKAAGGTGARGKDAGSNAGVGRPQA